MTTTTIDEIQLPTFEEMEEIPSHYIKWLKWLDRLNTQKKYIQKALYETSYDILKLKKIHMARYSPIKDELKRLINFRQKLAYENKRTTFYAISG